MWEVLRRCGALVLAASLLLSFVQPGGETKKASLGHLSSGSMRVSRRANPDDAFSFFPNPPSSSSAAQLEYDYYRSQCPEAEDTVRSTMALLYSRNASVAPALLRLVFHDCFIQGCDASVLLDRINGSPSERDAIPNQTLKGFDAIDTIKARLEEACPATVSCADILVLAARDGVVLSGGPFYPLLTGRKDSNRSYFSEAQVLIPSPNDSFSKTLSNFAARGFSDRETVALLGAHSVGTVHCRFFQDRLYNFSGTGKPDGSLDPDMRQEMRATCGNITASGSDVDVEPGMVMGFRPGEARPKGRTGRFDSYYYNGLLEGRGILHSDQQLTAGRTVRWVHAYAAGVEGSRAFRADFAHAMVKLSGLGAHAGAQGHVRTTCSQLTY